MQERAVPHRFADHLVVVFAVLALAFSLSYLEVVRPTISDLAHQLGLTAVYAPAPAKVEVAQPQPAPTPAPVVQPTPAPAPVVAPPAAPAAKTAATVSFVHMRAGKSTSTAIVLDLDGGTVVTLRNDSDPTWQGVSVNGKDGYIYKTYLQY